MMQISTDTLYPVLSMQITKYIHICLVRYIDFAYNLFLDKHPEGDLLQQSHQDIGVNVPPPLDDHQLE